VKRETTQEKLLALLGLTEVAKEVKERATGRVMGITEEEIQSYREIQGMIYFLQAPQLFTAKVCPNCDTPFVVSRKQVGFCSYVCIAESLRKMGIEWSKEKDLDALVLDPQFYNGNEPIWIRRSNLLRIQEIVGTLLEKLPVESESSPAEKSPPDKDLLVPSVTLEPKPSLSQDSVTLPTKASGKSSSKTSGVKVNFG
jgi:hypothetical protein